jgi:transposase InsO family protein
MNIKFLNLDNGGEYSSNEFKDLCKEVGIKREMTISYNPHRNGVAERKNHSIINFAKAMIHDKKFSMFLWDEACNITV